MEILNVENLGVEIEAKVILKNISFSVKEGEVLVILGPNGAGKTTLLKALLGLVKHSGLVKWKTKKISYLPPQEFLERKYLPPLSVWEFFKLKCNDAQKIKKMLKMVGLKENDFKKNFNALSTGEFQRMLIAWALINEPDVLLFDEPTSDIDVGGEQTIYSLLRQYWEKKKITILLVTHDLNIVYGQADNVLCINKKGLCYGRPRRILSPGLLEKLYGSGIKFYKHRWRK